MPTRATPYAFGMYAALLHIRDKDHDYMESVASQIYEWIAVVIVAVYSIIGSEHAMVSHVLGNPIAVVIWTCTSRQIFGAAVSYLTVLMLSPSPKDSIPFYRPSRYIRGFLSMNIWVPFANMTYTFYLFHLTPVMVMLAPSITKYINDG